MGHKAIQENGTRGKEGKRKKRKWNNGVQAQGSNTLPTVFYIFMEEPQAA